MGEFAAGLKTIERGTMSITTTQDEALTSATAAAVCASPTTQVTFGLSNFRIPSRTTVWPPPAAHASRFMDTQRIFRAPDLADESALDGGAVAGAFDGELAPTISMPSCPGAQAVDPRGPALSRLICHRRDFYANVVRKFRCLLPPDWPA
jgi:hypothetical protein